MDQGAFDEARGLDGERGERFPILLGISTPLGDRKTSAPRTCGEARKGTAICERTFSVPSVFRRLPDRLEII